MTRRGLAGWIAALVVASGACRRDPEPAAVHARFGVFFGGQVQERTEIPLVFERARQSIGVRLEFAEPPRTPERVTWELEKPHASKKGASLGSIVDYGEARTRTGEAVLDVPLAFRPGDQPGTWRVRVALEGRNVLDRGFKVIPASDPPGEE